MSQEELIENINENTNGQTQGFINDQDKAVSEQDTTSLTFQGQDQWYSLGFSKNPNKPLRVALGTLKNDLQNKIDILEINENKSDINQKFSIPHQYPPTKLMWGPVSSNQTENLIATTSDSLNIFRVNDDQPEHLCRLINENQPEFASPMTSFDWNPKDSNIICCSSIDTTCSLWDIHEQKLQKLVITHDKEVFDISFGPDGNNFVTVGCDFTARLFDIRDLTESSIICEYEEPLIRIAWNSSVSTHLLAVTTLTGKDIFLHDIRSPLVPINKLSFHEAPVNDLVWSPDSPFLLCSISQDHHAYLWNVEQIESENCVPVLEYSSETVLSAVDWGQTLDWIGISKKNTFIMLRII